MKSRTLLLTTLLAALLGLVLLTAAPTVRPTAAQDTDDGQATIDALVQQRFQQTLEASGGALTQTAQADASATAAFNATVDAAFRGALTATAQAQTGNVTLVPQATTAPASEEVVALRIILAAQDDVDDETLAEAADVIEQRLEALDIPAVVDTPDSTIRVRIPAQLDQDEVLRAVQQSGLVEFVDFSGLIDQITTFDQQMIVTTEGEARGDAADGALENPLTDAPFETVVTSADFEDVQPVLDPMTNSWQLQFSFSESGGETMSEFSRTHIGEPMAIVLDGRVLSIPLIQAEFGTGGGVISGGFTQADVERLALQLNYGALPVALTVESVTELTDIPEALANVLDSSEPDADATAEAAPTITPGPSPTADPRPTATTGQIQVAEQVFENGRMFYLQPIGQIWVMLTTDEGKGTWTVYEDTFVEGETEFDPSIVAPEGMYQPERGFGKLWRENDEVRDALGWGLTPEFGYVSDYRYQPGGVPGAVAPGYHVVFSLYNEEFRFYEADNTWELIVADE